MEQIEQRKEKAAELSSGRHANTDYAPKLTPYERKKHCSLCGVVVSTVSSRQFHDLFKVKSLHYSQFRMVCSLNFHLLI